MIRGKELEKEVFSAEHINTVLEEIESNFQIDFATFSALPLETVFEQATKDYEAERKRYKDYMSLQILEAFEDDPNAFKSHTRKKCPIILHCLMSQDEVMKEYKKSFNRSTGRGLLNSVKSIASFGINYVSDFNDSLHEQAQSFTDLGLEELHDEKYYCHGVIGYGVQSSLLYGLYAHAFAHRSQNAIWSLYFLSGRKDFSLEGGSEFLIARPDYGTCEQNYFYPPELFGFYAIKTYLMLKQSCIDKGIMFYDRLRYIYLSVFNDHIAGKHREDINCLKWSSDDVENHWF